MNFVAIDFETATSERSSVCSLGIAIVENGIVADTAYWLVKPKKLYFETYNTYIHGITLEDVIHEPEFCELWPKIKPYLENRIVIAHNASFDLSVLRYVLAESDILYPALHYTCSWMIAKKHWPHFPSHKLNSISEILGIQLKHHNALEDAVACAKIVIQACKERGAPTVEALTQSLEITMGELFPGGHKASTQKNAPSAKKVLRAKSKNFDSSHPFYQKNFVFTGALHTMSRKTAMQKVIDLGGFCYESVSPELHYLVVGSQHFNKNRGPVKSSKLKKVEALIEAGLRVEIIDEQVFCGMIR